MKRFEDFTKDELWALRQQIVLNSLYIADYRNDFGIDERSVCEFFDGFMSYAQQEEKEDGRDSETVTEFFERYDNPDPLWEWYCCFDDFDWVEYDATAADEWFYEADFDTMERISGERRDDYSDEDGYQDFVDAVERWWDDLSDNEKVDIYIGEAA